MIISNKKYNLFENDTITAIATANGIGSISIVRLSGQESLQIAKNITKKNLFEPRLATLSNIYDDKNALIDEVLIIYFKAPFSFTGEEVVEFHCHGGIAISSMLIDEILKNGARLANPGEFSKRAFLNKKIDLTKAEAISKIIESKNSNAVKLLAKQLKGELKDFVEQIRQDLLFILAYSEVSIDYAEEDLPKDIYEQINLKIDQIIVKLENTLESSKRREGLIEGFKVAIIGKPNVGKSSLLNKLLNFDRAIISDIAGTTRDTIEENVRIGTHIIKIVDTAGIRDSSDFVEKIGIEKSIQAFNEADLIIVLFDNSKNFDEEDKNILNIIKAYPLKKIISVVNKSDLENKFDKTNLNKYIELSAKNDINILIDKIKEFLDSNISFDEITLVSKRQVLCVEEALKSIILSKQPLISGELEFFSYYINEALVNISSITRPYDNDQMLDVMFGEFCLGK